MTVSRVRAGIVPGVIALALVGCGAGAEAPFESGGGELSGAHYNLNIIGVPKGKTADMTGDNGHRIFTPLYGSSKILLSEGAFQVVDANGTDGSAAFQLPNPDPDGDGTTNYSVFARALGKPGGSSTTTTCYTDTATGDLYCSLYSMVLVRSKGGSTWTNVSRELLTACIDTDGDGKADSCVPLFADGTQDWYWQYDNNGLKLAQLRFYEQIQTRITP